MHQGRVRSLRERFYDGTDGFVTVHLAQADNQWDSRKRFIVRLELREYIPFMRSAAGSVARRTSTLAHTRFVGAFIVFRC